MPTRIRTHTALFALIAASAALAFACSGSDKPAPTATPPPAHFADAPCKVATPAGQTLRCGVLTVPENRKKAGSRTIDLTVAVMKSTSATPAPDPMLYLSGGPGQPGLANNMQAFDAAFAAPVQSKRDLVFLDQRGTGDSIPSLACPEVNDAFRKSLAEDLRNDATTAGQAAILEACHDRLAKDGVDFTAYSSEENARDVADLMRALGYDAYNIYGLSYGTRLALETMRQDPQHVRSVILDSTLPPQARGDAETSATFERALNTLVAGCKADSKCAAAYPNLESTYFELVAKANQQPITVRPTDPSTGDAATVVINGDRILAGTQQAFYDTDLLPLLPFAAKSIASGNTAVLEQIAQRVAFTTSDFAQAMQTAVGCNDRTMSLTAADVTAAVRDVRPEILASHLGITDDASLRAQQDLCRAYGISSANASAAEPVTSSIPTLILAGEYDPVTPPEWGKQAAQTLSHSYFFEFPGSGHGELFGRHDCAIALAASFLDDPSKQPDGSCVSSLGEPAFLVQ